MSLSLIIQEPDYIIISGDTRASRFINGLQYAVNDEIKKLYAIDNNKIIFAGGNVWVAEQAVERYKLSSDKSIDNLNDIGKEVVNEFENKYPDAAAQFERKFELVVACFENEKSAIYSLSSYEGYTIKKTEENSKMVACIGTRRDEALRLYNKFKYIMSPLTAYQAIYNSIANEEVGGNVIIYVLTKDGIQQKHEFKIIDQQPVRRYAESEKLLIESSIGPESGFTCVKSDNTVKAEMNATEGISIKLSDDNGNTWEAVFYVTVENGVPKLYLGGPAVFTGSVTGATIKTAVSGKRIEITEDGLVSYDSSNNKSGIAIDLQDTLSALYFYKNDALVGGLTDSSGGMALGATPGNELFLVGNINFMAATVVGLIDYATKEWVENNFVHQ